MYLFLAQKQNTSISTILDTGLEEGQLELILISFQGLVPTVCGWKPLRQAGFFQVLLGRFSSFWAAAPPTPSYVLLYNFLLVQCQNLPSTFSSSRNVQKYFTCQCFSPILFIVVGIYNFYSLNIFLIWPWEKESRYIFLPNLQFELKNPLNFFPPLDILILFTFIFSNRYTCMYYKIQEVQKNTQ